MSTITQDFLDNNFQQAKSIAESQHCTIDKDYKLTHDGATYEPTFELDNENPKYVIMNVKYQISIETTIELKVLSIKWRN
jgi:hypothetical protein